MNTLNISLTSSSVFANPYVLVDGEPVKLTRKHRLNVATYTTDKPSVDVVVGMRHQVESPLWFLWELLFLVISVFGIFNGYYNRSGYCVDFSATVQLDGDTDLALRWCKRRDNGPALMLPEGSSNITFTNNRMYINKMLRRRYRIILALQLLLLLPIVIILLILLVKNQG